MDATWLLCETVADNASFRAFQDWVFQRMLYRCVEGLLLNGGDAALAKTSRALRRIFLCETSLTLCALM